MLGANHTSRHQGGIFRRFIKNKEQLIQHIFQVLVSLTSIMNIKSVNMLKFPLDHILVQMLYTQHTKFKQLQTYSRWGSLLCGVVITAVWTVVINICNLEF
jgi:hypothetical protein